MEIGARDAQGLPLLAKAAPRQSYAPMAGITRAFQPRGPTPMEPGREQVRVRALNKRHPGKFYFAFFTTKDSTVIHNEGG